MIPKNCLSLVLDRLNERGGYFVVRLSEHWRGLHVLWMSPSGELEQYSPPAKLDSPWRAFVGYEGAWVGGDRSELARPIPRLSLVAGSWTLAIGVTVWALWRLARGRP